MPKAPLEEYERSHPLSEKTRNHYRIAMRGLALNPLFDMFEEAIIELAWKIYFQTTPKEELILWEENMDILEKYIPTNTRIVIAELPQIVSPNASHLIASNIDFPYELPVFSNEKRPLTYHHLHAPTKLQKQLKTLARDIRVFNDRAKKLDKDLRDALDSCRSTKQFIDRYPDFAGFLQDALKKKYAQHYPDLIQILSHVTSTKDYKSLKKRKRVTRGQASTQPTIRKRTHSTQAQQARQPLV